MKPFRTLARSMTRYLIPEIVNPPQRPARRAFLGLEALEVREVLSGFSDGANSLFVGHSFFVPVARSFDELARQNEFSEHEAAFVFSPGPGGLPGQLWENETTKNAITEKLATGEVELFGLTAFSELAGSTFEDYQRWFDVALAYNPDTEFFIGQPWVPGGPRIPTDQYDQAIEANSATTFEVVGQLREAYPNTSIEFVDYGKVASIMKADFEAGELPDILGLVPDPENMIRLDEALFADGTIGHAGPMMEEVSALVWMSVLYGADVETLDYTAYTSDVESIVDEVVTYNEQFQSTDEIRVGYEILQVTPNGIITWANNGGITQEEFDAIELPPGWFKNQPREVVTSGSTFANSPNADPGVFVEEELYGHSWRHVATIVEANVPLDDDAILTANTIVKSHEVTFDADSTLSILISPEGEHYVLISRDAGRTSDTPTIPVGWQLVEHTLTEELVVQLPNPTTNIRADNEDSFQGPVPELAALLNDDEPGDGDDAVIRTTADGVEFVRTPDEHFESLPDWPYEPKYVEIDGLRQAYVDEGPEDGPVVLLLHGQPSWSYLYRDMIPVLADAGYRVIAMDHLGMGRSDKPIDIESYSFLNHTYRLEEFIQELGLEDINLFAQDWGSVIGLHVAGLNPDWFASITIGNGSLPVFPEDFQPFPEVENPDAILPLPSPYANIPDQQVPFYDENGNLLVPRDDNSYFGYWINYAMTGESFRPSETVEALTWFDIPAEEEAAYDAPFPSRIYMAGPRTFPSLVNDLPGVNQASFAGLQSYEKPFLTIWAANDPGAQGSLEAQQLWIDNVPGAEGQPHARLDQASHFLQDDQGVEIANRLVDFYKANGIDPDGPEILSAYLGAVDVRFPRALENVSGSPQARGDDGMPIVFSVQIDASTLEPEDFIITTESGATTTPSAVTLAPAEESDELRTVLLTGPLGSADDLPVSVEIVGSVLSLDSEELQGLTSEVTTNENGPSLVLALLDPAETNADDDAEPARIQLTFQGGVTGPLGSPIGLRELRGIRIIDENGEAHRPVGFEDLGDNDNHVVIVVPEGVTPVSVEVEAGTFYDPTNRPNPDTSVEVTGTIDLEEEPERRRRLRDIFGGRPGRRLAFFHDWMERRGM